ncbi:MAG: co-chaperone GroES, partial [Nocardioidaceae bacterium]
MLHDRVLVSLDSDAGERTSSAGIVIPATAAMGRRLAWARVAGVGSNVRTVEVGDRV